VLTHGVSPVPAGESALEAATIATYVGSAEHKDHISSAGAPRLRADATPCPPELTDASVLSDWLRKAITAGCTGAQWEQGFPRYAWWREGDACYQARLVNAGLGQYKGWPIPKHEWPTELAT
jgi:hypothetical protein